MRDLNEVTIRGRLAFNPDYFEEPRRTSFAVITNIPFVNKAGEAGRETTLHRVIVWNKNLSYLKQGDSIKVIGMVSLREKDGAEKQYRIIADEVIQIL